MDAASYVSAPTNAATPRPPADNSGRSVGGPRAKLTRGAPWAATGTEVRRRDALIAPEGLREPRRLAVADPVRHLAHGQRARGEHFGRFCHADAGQVISERGLADLGVGPLELTARRRDASCDVVQ